MQSKTNYTHWVDCLTDKHECWDFDKSARPMSVLVNGESVKLFVPEFLSDFKVIHASRDDRFLHVIARQNQVWDKDQHLGAMLVARMIEPNTYTTVVYHELYPYALKYLKLSPDGPKSKS